MKLLELIDVNTSKVSEFKKRDEEEQKRSEQTKIDGNFSLAINDVNQTIIHLCAVKAGADFRESHNLSKMISELLDTCKTIASLKHVKASDTVRINSMNREVNKCLSDEWDTYYVNKTSSIKEILNLAGSVSSNKSKSLISDINAASDWDASVNEVVRMTEAIEEANSLIDTLELNDEVIEFLKKMVSYKATLNDLSSEVLCWIEKEGLKNQIKLSFE